MTEDEVRERLEAAIAQAGSAQAWAAAHRVSPQYVADVRARRRAPGASILRALRVRRVVSYEENGDDLS